MDEDLPDIDTGLIDLTGVDLAMVEMLADSALARSLRRVIQLSVGADDAVASFQDSI